MKLLTKEHKVLELPAHGSICGTRIIEVTFNSKDIENILGGTDDQIRKLLESLLVRFPPAN